MVSGLGALEPKKWLKRSDSGLGSGGKGTDTGPGRRFLPPSHSYRDSGGVFPSSNFTIQKLGPLAKLLRSRLVRAAETEIGCTQPPQLRGPRRPLQRTEISGQDGFVSYDSCWF